MDETSFPVAVVGLAKDSRSDSVAEECFGMARSLSHDSWLFHVKTVRVCGQIPSPSDFLDDI